MPTPDEIQRMSADLPKEDTYIITNVILIDAPLDFVWENLPKNVDMSQIMFLMLSQDVDWIVASSAISRHSSTLRRVVCHHLEDIGGSWFNDSEIPWNPQWEYILQGNSLCCFGTSMLPQVLLRHCRSMLSRPTCRLMHFRTSGVVLDGQVPYEQPTSTDPVFGTQVLGRRPLQTLEDEHEFAHWAFGADGLPNLQVLAFGDFSYEGRYSKYNVLLCRSENGYQKLARGQMPYWDLVQNHMDMLEARSYDPIMES